MDLVSKQLSLIREESERGDSDTLLSRHVDQRTRIPEEHEFNQDDVLLQLLVQSQPNPVSTERQTSVIVEHDESASNSAVLADNVEVVDAAPLLDQHEPSPSSPARNRTASGGSAQSNEGKLRCFQDISSLNDSRLSPVVSRKRTRSENCPLVYNRSIKKRFSMPIIVKRKDSTASTNSTNSSILDRQSREIFDQLDKLDGEKDGLISKKHLKKWISSSAQELNNLNFKEKQISGLMLNRLISQFDENKDGHIDEQEFEKLFNQQNEEDRPELRRLLLALRTTAFAEVYKLWPPPVFLLLISTVQLILFIVHADHLQRNQNLTISWHEPAPRCSVFIYNPHRRWEIWRFLTYCLVHSGIAHVTVNLVMQLFVGLPLEMSHGKWRTGLVYLTGVIAGSLATSCLDPNMYLVGASGGVYSLIAAHLASLMLNWNEDAMMIRQRFRRDKHSKVKGSTVYRLMRLISVVIFVLCDTGYAMFSRIMHGNGNIGYVAHLAGGGAGFFVGLIALKNRKKEAWEIYMKVMCALFCLGLGIFAIVWNVEGNKIHGKYSDSNFTYFPPPDYSNIQNCSYSGLPV